MKCEILKIDSSVATRPLPEGYTEKDGLIIRVEARLALPAGTTDEPSILLPESINKQSLIPASQGDLSLARLSEPSKLQGRIDEIFKEVLPGAPDTPPHDTYVDDYLNLLLAGVVECLTQIDQLPYPNTTELAQIVDVAKKELWDHTSSTLQKWLVDRYQLSMHAENPEIPDLYLIVRNEETLEALISALLTTNQAAIRYEIYKTLEQIYLPTEMQKTLFKFMFDQGELSQTSLGMRLLTSLDQDSPDATAEYYANIDGILPLLEGDATQVFEHIDKVLTFIDSGKVLSTHDMKKMRGKVGFEIERRQINASYELNQSRYNGVTIGNNEVGTDHKCEETRRSDKALDWGLDYVQDFHLLGRFFSLTHPYSAERDFSMHIHLDALLHPGSGFLRGLLSTRRNNPAGEGTREARDFIPPIYGDYLDVANTCNFINLLIDTSVSTTAPAPTLQLVKEDILYLEDNFASGFSRIIFKHICELTASPRARLAALTLLCLTPVLKLVNPAALKNTFVESKELQDVIDAYFVELCARGDYIYIRKLLASHNFSNSTYTTIAHSLPFSINRMRHSLDKLWQTLLDRYKDAHKHANSNFQLPAIVLQTISKQLKVVKRSRRWIEG